MSAEPIDLGHGHTIRFVGWGPDRALNPRYEGIPDDPHAGAIVDHAKPIGGECEGGFVTFDSAPAPVLADGRPTWHIESWEPLTMSPSLLCSACGDHGFIREGRWVPA